ncbi:hypothetical protein [Pyrodictium abyssi]|uniref:HTH marR-type domain-containing protein n=1 Tax=Pyrodictium abyssi TaxID=54256 RepID=A0ABN6ZSM8_9CREN|nr:hypothetical protein PABY_04980 [Pyrodictium abyssi]
MTAMDALAALYTLLAALAALTVLAVLLSSQSGRRREDESVSTPGRGSASGWVEEPLHSGAPIGGASRVVEARLLEVLGSKKALPFEELEVYTRASREKVLQALRELERRGLVRVENGVVMFSEKGEKLVTRLREKALK